MIVGRHGHARVVVLSVIPSEWQAALAEFGCSALSDEVDQLGVYSPNALHDLDRLPDGRPNLPFIVTRTTDRSNGPSQESAQRLLEHWRPEFIVLTGIAGGVRRLTSDGTALEGPEPGDVVIGEYIHYCDYGKDLPNGFLQRYYALAHPPTALIRRHTDRLLLDPSWSNGLRGSGGAGPKIHHGEILAVESVAANPTSQRQQAWLRHFDKALAVEMESAGVARAVHESEGDVHYNPRWFVVRGISDSVVGSEEAERLLGSDNQAERDAWAVDAAKSSARVARLLTERLVCRPREVHPAQAAGPAWAGVESST